MGQNFNKLFEIESQRKKDQVIKMRKNKNNKNRREKKKLQASSAKLSVAHAG